MFSYITIGMILISSFHLWYSNEDLYLVQDTQMPSEEKSIILSYKIAVVILITISGRVNI